MSDSWKRAKRKRWTCETAATHLERGIKLWGTAAMSSIDLDSNQQQISVRDRETLIDVARSSIRSGLGCGDQPVIEPTAFADALRALRASFVTLRIGADLRGCIGSVEACRPVVVDVAENAFAAAFRDPRFPPLRHFEYPTLTIQISVLGPLEPLRFASEADLLKQMREGTDGLEIEFGRFRGLLLPSVWEQLPDKRQFLRTLKIKAGLPATFWSRRMNVYRFTTESFGRKPTAFSETANE